MLDGAVTVLVAMLCPEVMLLVSKVNLLCKDVNEVMLPGTLATLLISTDTLVLIQGTDFMV